MIFERIIENRQIAPENGCIYDRPKNRENDDENDEKMNDPKSIESLGFGLACLGRVWCRYMRKDALRVPGGNQVDNLPPAASKTHLRTRKPAARV